MTERPETSRGALADKIEKISAVPASDLQITRYQQADGSFKPNDGSIKEVLLVNAEHRGMIVAALRAPPAVEDGARLWRHKKRRTVYTEIGRGLLQTADAGSLTDNEPMVIYRDNNTGNFWVRDAIEFEDGRFEEVVETGPVTENEYAPLSQPQIEGGAVREALENCLGCVEAAEAEGLHEVISELRGFSEQTDRLIDLVERRLLWVRNYAEAALAPPQTGDGK